MEKQIHHDYLKLGASLYVPCTRKDLTEVAEGKIKARSIIFCLEDSVNENELDFALNNLQDCLYKINPNSNMLRFIRVRNLKVMESVLKMTNIGEIDGFVLPKISATNILDYTSLLPIKNNFWLMPTLETIETFDNNEMIKLRDTILSKNINSILTLRIGGNDLMNLIGVRRSRVRTIYDSPLAPTLANLSTIFKPYGFNLTAPVFELLDNRELLTQEVIRDLEYGFFGKTAIHPDQISIIENLYKVFVDDKLAAENILSDTAPAVFKCNGSMCEPTTHKKWAENIISRSNYYGIIGS